MARGRILSFKYAFSGIWSAIREEPNMKIHILAMVGVIVFGIFFGISLLDWIAVTLAIGLVITLELTNTAIEEVVDSFTDSAHPGAKRAKDVASGAVLVMSITAMIIGIIVFLPYFLRFLNY